MAEGVKTMGITIDVKPDLSRFRQADADEVTDLLINNSVEHPVDAVRVILENYILLPR